MLRVLYVNVRFADIGLMPAAINTYRDDPKKAIGDYLKRMREAGVEVLSTSDAHWAGSK